VDKVLQRSESVGSYAGIGAVISRLGNSEAPPSLDPSYDSAVHIFSTIFRLVMYSC